MIFFGLLFQLHRCHSQKNMFASHQKLKSLFEVSLFRTTCVNLFCTKTTSSQGNSFAVSYLINNLGFSPQSALEASKRLRFNTPRKADSVVAFLKSHGFSDSHISKIVSNQYQILTSSPETVLPKFQFLASKGASPSDIVMLVTKYPAFTKSSLENNIIPSFNLIREFFATDEEAISVIVRCPFLIMWNRLEHNVKMLLDEGISSATIRYLFRTRGLLLLELDLKKAVDEVKELGFEFSQMRFGIALVAIRAVPKAKWKAKVDAFKMWGWSEELVYVAFRRQPLCMITSLQKINEVMRVWVDQFGWNPLDLARLPTIFGYSLERRVIPRAFVLQYLNQRGLRDKKLSLLYPFNIPEEVFLRKFVERFTEERSQLLKIYQENKGKYQDNRKLDE